jgi:hypothetical protein
VVAMARAQMNKIRASSPPGSLPDPVRSKARSLNLEVQVRFVYVFCLHQIAHQGSPTDSSSPRSPPGASPREPPLPRRLSLPRGNVRAPVADEQVVCSRAALVPLAAQGDKQADAATVEQQALISSAPRSAASATDDASLPPRRLARSTTEGRTRQFVRKPAADAEVVLFSFSSSVIHHKRLLVEHAPVNQCSQSCAQHIGWEIVASCSPSG